MDTNNYSKKGKSNRRTDKKTTVIEKNGRTDVRKKTNVVEKDERTEVRTKIVVETM